MNLLERFIKVVMARISMGSSDYDHKRDDFFDTTFNEYDQRNTRHQWEEAVNPKIAQYYANLEIPIGSDLKTVKSAWKRLMRKYHPDIHGNDKEKQKIAIELTQQLNRAYEELCKHLRTKKTN
jgi:DnaJ-domain-containing protein 1